MSTETLHVGQQAPDLTLADQNGATVTLSTLTDSKHVVLVFFPFAFSGICTGELDEIRDDLGDFVGDDLEVLALSCDPTFALRAWADAQGYFFQLLSDFWPHGSVATAYGVFRTELGAATRATFLVERGGTVRFAFVGEPGERRDFGPLRAAVASLRAVREARTS